MRTIDHLVIVEDDSISLLITQKKLRSAFSVGKCSTFANGALALEYITATLLGGGMLPAVIFLDINMPVMNGWQFLDSLNKLGPAAEVPVVMLTSSIDPQDMKKAESYPAVKGFISKPLTTEHLEQMSSLMQAECTD